MPRLTRNQREQAIGRLHIGQSPLVVANDLNCSIQTHVQLWERYNVRNSSDDRPRSNQPRVTTSRQDRHLLR
uniref:Paired domain-containing protein n=1 Tax=Octopus bimaculoides TaxID=37653 RepID=A0A0L8G849_OCTBM